MDEEQAKLTLADYFDIHLDHAPKEGASLPLDSIVLVARSIGGGRVNVVGLRLPEDEEDVVPETRAASVQAQAVADLGVGGGDLIASVRTRCSTLALAISRPNRHRVRRGSQTPHELRSAP